jgi:hypothetical protein
MQNKLHHDQLLKEIKDFIFMNGGECYETSIHDLNPTLSNKIKYQQHPASKMLSSTPDLFVIPKHKDKPTFYLDCKTSWKYKLFTTNPREMITYEAIQVDSHKSEYNRMGVQCMYIVQDVNGDKAAFWVHEMEILEILCPSDTRYSKEIQFKLVKSLTSYTPYKQNQFRVTGPIRYQNEYGEYASGDMMVIFEPQPDKIHTDWENFLHNAL